MKLVLITWALVGGQFIYAFSANFRTMLLMPQYEAPVDSAQDVLDRGMTLFVTYSGEYYKQFLLQSSNPAYQKLGENVVIPKDYDQYLKMHKEDVQGANTHIFLGCLAPTVYYFFKLLMFI